MLKLQKLKRSWGNGCPKRPELPQKLHSPWYGYGSKLHHRGFSVSPFTRVPFWVPLFDPQPKTGALKDTSWPNRETTFGSCTAGFLRASISASLFGSFAHVCQRAEQGEPWVAEKMYFAFGGCLLACLPACLPACLLARRGFRGGSTSPASGATGQAT